MKKIILDEPIRDSFADYLDKGETILWQFRPIPTNAITISTFRKQPIHIGLQELVSNVGLTILLIGYVFFLSEANNPFHIFFTISFTLLILILSIIRIINISQKTEYAITQKRIFFRLAHLPEQEIQQIQFSEINNCVLSINKNGTGTIFLAVKDPANIPFDTYENLETQKDSAAKRSQPTLENVEEPQSVVQLIRQGIQQNR